jgi:hypothetical protein
MSDSTAFDLGLLTGGVQLGEDCRWRRDGMVADFTPYPTEDKTLDPALQHLPVTDINGHRTLVGKVSNDTIVAHTILVSTGPNQSFRVFVSNYGPVVPDKDAIQLGSQVARAIVENLT